MSSSETCVCFTHIILNPAKSSESEAHLYLYSRHIKTGKSVTASQNTWGAFHLVKNSENSDSALNGKRFFGSPGWKIPRKSGTA